MSAYSSLIDAIESMRRFVVDNRRHLTRERARDIKAGNRAALEISQEGLKENALTTVDVEDAAFAEFSEHQLEAAMAFLLHLDNV